MITHQLLPYNKTALFTNQPGKTRMVWVPFSLVPKSNSPDKLER